jgi:hypothetical protein
LEDIYEAELEARRWDEAELVAGKWDKAELKLADRKTRRNWKESGGIGVCIQVRPRKRC